MKIYDIILSKKDMNLYIPEGAISKDYLCSCADCEAALRRFKQYTIPTGYRRL